MMFKLMQLQFTIPFSVTEPPMDGSVRLESRLGENKVKNTTSV